jgi:hypothetical protein
MKQKVLYIILFIVLLGLVIFSFSQQGEIKKLKATQEKYEILTKSFKELHNNYESSLLEYSKIKKRLDKNNLNLDSLSNHLDSLNQKNIVEINTINEDINAIISSIDITYIEHAPIIDLDSLFVK